MLCQIAQLPEADWLDQDQIRFILHDRGLCGIGGDDDDVGLRQIRILSNMMQYFAARNLGQVKIEDDQRRTEGYHLRESNRAIRRNDWFKMSPTQRLGVDQRQFVVVFDDERQRIVRFRLGKIACLHSAFTFLRPAIASRTAHCN